ncbi:MAG: AAA family ATPase [Oligoflexales bacterium]
MISNNGKANIEDQYLAETSSGIIERDDIFVLSGCSGGGKSTLLSELAGYGYSIIPEPGREIVKEQTVISGPALPWKNLDKFLELALSRYIFRFNSEPKNGKPVFADRSIIDAVLLNSAQPSYFQAAARKFRYNKTVFLVPPWPELFKADSERKHSYKDAVKEYDELVAKYKKYGYKTILVPKTNVKERASFILEHVNMVRHTRNDDFALAQTKKLLKWNQQKLTHQAELKKSDLKELFSQKFTVKANERTYDADYENYYAFLNQFRSTIKSIEYDVQEYIVSGLSITLPLTAKVTRLSGSVDMFSAIMLVKYSPEGKIVHWQEVYSKN